MTLFPKRAELKALQAENAQLRVDLDKVLAVAATIEKIGTLTESGERIAAAIESQALATSEAGKYIGGALRAIAGANDRYSRAKATEVEIIKKAAE
jgi:hypothetical protein